MKRINLGRNTGDINWLFFGDKQKRPPQYNTLPDKGLIFRYNLISTCIIQKQALNEG